MTTSKKFPTNLIFVICLIVALLSALCALFFYNGLIPGHRYVIEQEYKIGPTYDTVTRIDTTHSLSYYRYAQQIMDINASWDTVYNAICDNPVNDETYNLCETKAAQDSLLKERYREAMEHFTSIDTVQLRVRVIDTLLITRVLDRQQLNSFHDEVKYIYFNKTRKSRADVCHEFNLASEAMAERIKKNEEAERKRRAHEYTMDKLNETLEDCK